MARDGRLNVRLGPLKPHLEELANRGRKSARRRPVSEFIFDELEKVVIKKCPGYRPDRATDPQLAETAN